MADAKREPTTVEKPWGSFREFTRNEPSTVKIITVKPGQAISLQKHRHRSEFWRVLSGKPLIQIGEAKTAAAAGDEFFIPEGTAHRISVDAAEAGEGAHAGEATLLEVSFGDFNEDDIVRLEDKYGRA